MSGGGLSLVMWILALAGITAAIVAPAIEKWLWTAPKVRQKNGK